MKLSIIDSHKMVQFRFKVDNFFEAKLALGAGEGDRTPYVHFGKVTFYR